MRKILIVGAGHSGLQLAHGLLNNGYDVTVITGQTSIEIRTGRPALTQLTMPYALELERRLHLDFWSAQAPQVEKMKVSLRAPGAPPITVPSRFGNGEAYSIAVDRRIKTADWLEYFEDCGGKVVIHGITVSDLDYFSRMFDLIVVAVGHGELGALFDHDASRFTGARPRSVAQVNLYDVAPDPGEKESVGWAATAPDLGNIFLLPFLTQDGPCHAFLISDKTDGNMKDWPARPRPQEQFELMRDAVKQTAPDYLDRLTDAELVDGRSAMRDTVQPQVRNPVGVLPSGGLVLGISDVVISMDPYVLQGWNHSARCADSYLGSILAHGDKPFDRAFLEKAFEDFWTYGLPVQHWAELNSTFWEGEAPPFMGELFGMMQHHQSAADRLMTSWNDPTDFDGWLFDEAKARAFMAQHSG
ncbi:styrene monooxygenase/indole monooxygenase family protein [Nocardiopsis coralliicola]